VKSSVGFCLCLMLLCYSAGCGGGSNSTLQPPPPPPPNAPAEFLYASDGTTVTTYSINTTSGALTQVSSVSGNQDGTEIAVSPSGSFLYVLDQPTVGIDAISVNSTGALSAVPGSPFAFPEANPFGLSGIAVDSTGKFLFAGDYGADVVAGFSINNSTGALSPIPGGLTSTGMEPRGIALDPSSKFLYVTNQLDDSVSSFTLNSTFGALAPVPGSPFALPGNSQPEAIAVHPTGKFVYAALFNSDGVAGFSVDSATGVLSTIGGSPFASEPLQFTQPNSVFIHPSGKFLYVLNLLDGTVTAFTIDPTSGALTVISGSPFSTPPGQFGSVGVQGPIVVDPSGTFLYAACANENLAAFRIDQTTGALTALVGSPLLVSRPAVGLAVASAP
jgi:6-phosphogluconolactonase